MQVDPLDNAVLLVIEEGDQSGYPCDQVHVFMRVLLTSHGTHVTRYTCSCVSCLLMRVLLTSHGTHVTRYMCSCVCCLQVTAPT